MRLAFALVVSICLFQDRSDDISTPRSRWDEMHFSSMLHIFDAMFTQILTFSIFFAIN